MSYDEKVLDHFENPRNVGSLDKDDQNVGTGLVGAPQCGDVLKLQIKVDPETQIISDVVFRSFGCGAAIAASSLMTEWVKGLTIKKAEEIKSESIVKELIFPCVKIHCSILSAAAVKAAIADWRSKNNIK